MPLVMFPRGMAENRKHDDLAADLVIGAISGIVATVAMTVAADVMFRQLPRSERYPLPPREITERIATRAGVHGLDEDTLVAVTLASHCVYGAGTGAALNLVIPSAMRNAGTSIAYALLVWLVSYLGWIPAMGILRPATTHPVRRNALMIAAHVVFGAALYASAALLSCALRPIKDGPLRDAQLG